MIFLPFWFGMIWNERNGSDMNRVITNRLLCSMAWTCIVFIVVVHSLDIVRYIYGPFPESICFFHHFLKNALIQQLVMFVILIFVFRYIFIFCLKNPMAFQDEFWAFFINIWLSTFCFLSQWLILYMPGHQPIMLYSCSGKNPSLLFVPKRNILSSTINILSIAILFGMYIRIEIFKWKESKLTTWLENQKSLYLKDIEDKFLASSFMYLLGILNTTIGTIILWKINSLKPFELNFYPNNLYVIFIQLIHPILVIGSGVLIYYIEHKKLIYILFSEIKEIIGL
jgi:hypothetical protein